MDKKRKVNTNRVAAYALSGVMLASMIPYNVFANPEQAQNALTTAAAASEPRLALSPAKDQVAVANAAEPEDTTTSADAKNAVHGFVGILVGGDVNADLKEETGQRFKPIEGVKVYFQWYEAKGNRTSPTYYAVSGADGQFHIKVKPYIGRDGKLIKFDADTTVSAGNESYKMWVDESTIPEGYQLQYSTGEGVEFTDRRVAGGGYQLGPNRLVNYRVLLMKKQDEAKMHKEATPTGPQIFRLDPGQGAVRGKVSWDYESAGGVQWGIVSTPTSPAEGVTVTASYLSDYALKQIYSADTANMLGVSSPSKIRGSGWTFKLETQLQEWIAEQVAADKDKWIAETVSAVTNAEGDYKIQFKGTWGPKWNDESVANYTAPKGWNQEQKDRIGTVAENATDGSFLTGALDKNQKHINSNWLFISTKDTDDVVKRTPWNYNWYTGSNDAWGIHFGWAQAVFGVKTTLAAHSIRADFNLAPAEIKFNITNFDTQANTATPGDVAKTNTAGLPYKNTNDSFKIVWYDQDGEKLKEEPTQKPTSTGSLAEATYDTKGITETKTFIAKLHYVDSKGKLGQVLAQDAFTVKVNDKIGSRYEDVEFTNGDTEGATYKASGLPNGLTIDEKTGKVTGKPTEAGKFTVTTTITVPADDPEAEAISVNKTDEYIITDSPLKDGNVNSAYSETVKPTEVEGYVFKNVSAKFIDGKAIDGLTITGDKISGTPTAKVDATQENPNVKVTYDIYQVSEDGQEFLVKKGHVDNVPLKVVEAAQTTADNLTPTYADKDGKAGEAVTTDAPTYKDADGKDTTAPEGTKYTLGENAPEGATIDENTGKVTYTPKESEAGKPVEIPVVVTYPDKSTDNASAKINVEALEDIIDRTGDEDKPTPDGYVRVTFKAGDGVNEIANNKVYDVKEGTALTADKYPEVTAKDGYENPVWSTPAGTEITADNATITATATKTTPAEKDADKYTPTADAVEKDKGTPVTEKDVTDAVKVPDFKENPKFPGETPKVTVDDPSTLPDGNTPGKTDVAVTVTYPDGSTDKLTVPVTIKDTTPAEDTTKPEIGDLDNDDDPTTPVAPKEDENNKGPQVWANGARVTEGQKITPIKVNVKDDKDKNPTVEVTGLPKGLSYNKETGKIEGTTDKLTDWADTEEERDVTATIKAKDAAGNESTKEIQITVLRDTDGDGMPDTTDPDDDNDGTNDDTDKNPKAWDAKVDGKVTTPKGTQPTVDQYKEKITNLPEGSEVVVKTQPDVSKAGDAEAVVTVTLPNGEEKDVTVPVTVTDTTPGTDTTKPEIKDLDDDNDPTTPVAPKEDENNKGPQVWANGARVVEGQKIKPIKVNVTDDKDENPTVEVTGLPKGLSYNAETGMIEGTPDKLTDWADTEEERDVTATIKAKDAAGNESTKEIQITVLRDTDGDGMPDTTDPDDDNDGTNDDTDKNPKAWDAKVDGKVTTPKGTQPTVDQYKEKITNLPEGSKVVIKTQPDVSKADDKQSAVVTVTLPNGEEVDVTVPVTVTDTTPTGKDADKYDPTVEKEEVEKGGKVDLTDNVTNLDKLPEGTKVEDVTPEGAIDTQTPGDYTGKIKVTYPDGSSEEVEVPVTVKDTTPAEKDADKYDPTVEKEEVEKGGKVDLTDNVTNLDKLPEGTKVEDVTPEGAIDTNTPGDYTGKIKVTYPDGSSEEKEVPVTVKDETPSDKDTKISGDVKPVDPTDEKQDTGINVENKDDDTKISAKDEDGKDIPVEIDENGNVKVTPGTDVDGPITVTIEDPDLPGGRVEIEVPVIGHEKGRDDNGSGDHGYIPGDNDYFFPGGFKRHDYTPTYPVKTVVPEKTTVGTPVEDTLWYVFRINDFEYDVVRNGVVTKRKMDVTPVLRNDRTMLPLRYVAEAIGAEVKWDKKTRTATFIKDGLTASIQIDSDEIVLSNGKTVKMDSKPLNINDRILVSVTNVANVFGLTNGNTQDKIDQDIEWEQEDKSATIYIRR